MRNQTQTAIEVDCPQCLTKTLYVDTNPYRPFCSERCRLIDLGEWASESYQIPVTSSVDADDFLESPEQKHWH